MDNIDSECLSHVNDTCFGDVGVDDYGCNDDDGCDDDVEDNGDKDEDYNAEEKFDSSDSEDMPLAKLNKLKSKLKKKALIVAVQK